MSSKVGIQISLSVSSLKWCCKTKICNLKYKLTIQKKIFWFEVSMANSITMAILKSLHKLSKVVPCNSFLKSTCHCDEIKQFTTFSKLENDIVDLFFTFLFDIHVLSVLNCLNNMIILKFCHGLNFCDKKVLFFGSHIIIHDLNSNLSTVGVNSKFNFAACT